MEAMRDISDGEEYRHEYDKDQPVRQMLAESPPMMILEGNVIESIKKELICPICLDVIQNAMSMEVRSSYYLTAEVFYQKFSISNSQSLCIFIVLSESLLQGLHSYVPTANGESERRATLVPHM
jgi:hypothetical protein